MDLGDGLGHAWVVERLPSVGGLVVVRISIERGVGDHDGGEVKGPVVAVIGQVDEVKAARDAA